MRRRSILGIAAGVALALAGCSSPSIDRETEIEPADEATSSSDDGVIGDGDVTANIAFNGEPLEFEEIHCAPVAAEDDEMRFLGAYQGGEVVIEESGEVNGTAVIIVRVDGEPDYSNSAGPELVFEGNEVHGDLEISNSEEETATVSVDVTC